MEVDGMRIPREVEDAPRLDGAGNWPFGRRILIVSCEGPFVQGRCRPQPLNQAAEAVDVLVERQVSHPNARGKGRDARWHEWRRIQRRQLQERVLILRADSRPDNDLEHGSSIGPKPWL